MSIKYENVPQMMKVGKKFTRLFKVPFKDYYDHELSIMTMTIQVDLDKFDALLNKKYNIDKKGISMSDCILEHYGNDASEFLKKLF